jgi:hypothetical protein
MLYLTFHIILTKISTYGIHTYIYIYIYIYIWLFLYVRRRGNTIAGRFILVFTPYVLCRNEIAQFQETRF